METKKELLEVGDVIFNYSGTGWRKHIVTRVTAKQAIAEGLTVKREIERGTNTFFNKPYERVKIIGSYGHADLYNDEINNQYREQNTLRKAKKLYRDFKIDSIDLEDAKKIISFIESITKQPTT